MSWENLLKGVSIESSPDAARVLLNNGSPAVVFDKFRSFPSGVVHCSFDWDSTLASSHEDKILLEKGRPAFTAFEQAYRDVSHAPGPLFTLFKELQSLPSVRLSIITARTASEGQRILTSISTWGLNVDGLYLCSDRSKGSIAKALGVHIHFDDILRHVQDADANGVIGAWLPVGNARV